MAPEYSVSILIVRTEDEPPRNPDAGLSHDHGTAVKTSDRWEFTCRYRLQLVGLHLLLALLSGYGFGNVGPDRDEMVAKGGDEVAGICVESRLVVAAKGHVAFDAAV